MGTVGDGRALLKAAAEHRPDVVVLDIAMPLLNGLDAARQLKGSMPEVKLTWDAYRLRGVPFLGWFSEGALSVSYAYFIQNTSFGNAHLLQMGYTLPY